MWGLIEAFGLLTIVPMPSRPNSGPLMLRRSMPFFPLVGLVAGLGAGAAYWIGAQLWAPIAGCALAVVFLAAVTGNLHLDGLADTADGVFGGTSKERRLLIMRDSRVGTHAVVAVVSALLLKLLFLWAVPAQARTITLMVSAAVGRWSAVYAATVYPYARSAPGTGRAFADQAVPTDLAWASAVALVAALLLLGGVGAAGLVAAVLATAIASRFISKRLGGMTGDTYGALVEVTEIAALAAVSALMRYAR